MEHVKENYRAKKKNILQKYSSLYDGNFTEVAATEKVIDLTEGAKLVNKIPYRGVTGSRTVVK